LATELYETGGHTGVIETLLSGGGSRYILCLTDIFGKYHSGHLRLPEKIELAASSVFVLPSVRTLTKVRFLANFLLDISPRAIFHFGHHQDCIGYTAVETAGLQSRSVLFHHCDHDPSLGATLAHAIHCDFSEELVTICGKQRSNVQLFPLVSAPPETVRMPTANTPPRFATSGTQVKFFGEAHGIRYADIVLRVLQSHPHSSLLHIGKLSVQTQSEIYTVLGGLTGARERFIELGDVDSVVRVLIEHSATIYLSSFPNHGGRATSEAQSIGLPVIFFDTGQKIPLIDWPSVFASHDLRWETLDCLETAIKKVASDYEMYSTKSMLHYARHNTREAMKRAISEIDKKLKILASQTTTD
jgi:hypothetical protein